MNLKEIKAAVEAGQVVHWGDERWSVVKSEAGRWIMVHRSAGQVIALVKDDGVTPNGNERDFYIGDPVPSGDEYKIWIQIERINDTKDEFENIGEPVEFGSYPTQGEALYVVANLKDGR